MKAEYHFSKGQRGQAVPTKGKTRITIYIDDQILAAFKAESGTDGDWLSDTPQRGTRASRGHRQEADDG